jgi:hypothetical protein
MTDTPRTLSAILALLADNTAGDISAQDARDLVVSITSALNGSGFVPYYQPDAIPNTAHANDDEFRDGSIGGSWTDWDPGSICTTTEGDHGIELLSVASSLAAAGIHRAVPVSSDWTLTTKVSLQRDNAANSFAGIMIAEDLGSSPTTGNLITLTVNYGGSGAQVEVNTWNDYLTYANSLALVTFAGQQSAYLRISKTSTTYRFCWSTTGSNWVQLYSTASLSITPVKVGLTLITDRGTTVRQDAMFRFWRQVDSANWYAPLLGRTP